MLPRQKAFSPGSGIGARAGQVIGAGHVGHIGHCFIVGGGGGLDKIAVFDGKKLKLKSAGMKNK
jgi:hypothetical protein